MVDVLFQALVGGFAIGSIYALLALGFSITFATTKTVNFAHGEFVSAGAFVYIAAMLIVTGTAGGASVVDIGKVWIHLAGLAAALLVMGVLGVLLYLVGVRPFAGKPGLVWVVTTLGFGVVLQSIGLALWGPGNVVVKSPIGDDLVQVFGASIRVQELLIIGVTFLVLLSLDLMMRFSLLGNIMKAVAHSPATSSLMGINVAAVMTGAFFLSSALAGLSGVLIAPISTASIYMGLAFGLKGFSAAMVGGLSNPRGCVLGGLMLGVIESLVNYWNAQFRDIAIFVLVIAILSIRPTGFFGGKLVEKT